MSTEVWKHCLGLGWELKLLITGGLTLSRQAEEGDDVQLTGTIPLVWKQ